MDDDTITHSDEITAPPKIYVEDGMFPPPENNVGDLLLQLELASSVKWDPDSFERLLPTWQNDIVVSEFFRMLTPYAVKHPDHKDILFEVFRDFIKAYLNEKDNHANPFIDCEKRLNWERMHQKLLAARTIEESCAVTNDAAKDGFRFRREYYAALNITRILKEMEARGLFEQAMEELYFASYFRKNLSLSREMEQNEQESKIKIFIKAEKKYRKLEPFLEYLHQVEDEWHNTQKIVGKENAIKIVFRRNVDKDVFIALFREHFGININDEAGAELAKKELTKMVDKYTKLWYEFNNGVSKNGHKRQRRPPHPDRVKKMIGESVKRTNARKNNAKTGNRPARSGKRTKRKTS